MSLIDDEVLDTVGSAGSSDHSRMIFHDVLVETRDHVLSIFQVLVFLSPERRTLSSIIPDWMSEDVGAIVI